jgi:predicted deacylase
MVLNKSLKDTTPFYQKGSEPTLLILSGTHGDEYEIIGEVTSYLDKNYSSVADFLFIPQVSPSAVKNKTRVNMHGSDLNRVFLPQSKDEEVQVVQSIIAPFHFDICLSFHEDPQFESFYMYDSDHLGDEKLKQFRDRFTQKNIPLFTGIDDELDPDLGCEIDQGYYAIKNSLPGTCMHYVIEKGIVKRFFTLEVPGKATKELKYTITEEIFLTLASLV